MGYKDHAVLELEHLQEQPSEQVKTILFKLLDLFSEQGHSGASAPFGVGLFERFSVHRDIDTIKQELLKMGYVPLDEEQEDGPNKWIQEGTLELFQAIPSDMDEVSYKQVVDYFTKLAMFKPLTPLTGEDWEWILHEDGSRQNKRLSSVFKDSDGSVYDINGKVFREPSGCCYTSRDSRVPVTFPYIPTREYVDVPASE